MMKSRSFLAMIFLLVVIVPTITLSHRHNLPLAHEDTKITPDKTLKNTTLTNTIKNKVNPQPTLTPVPTPNATKPNPQPTVTPVPTPNATKPNPKPIVTPVPTPNATKPNPKPTVEDSK
jgi:hypothetical protein